MNIVRLASVKSHQLFTSNSRVIACSEIIVQKSKLRIKYYIVTKNLTENRPSMLRELLHYYTLFMMNILHKPSWALSQEVRLSSDTESHYSQNFLTIACNCAMFGRISTVHKQLSSISQCHQLPASFQWILLDDLSPKWRITSAKKNALENKWREISRTLHLHANSIPSN